jgi:hypothetical protein
VLRKQTGSSRRLSQIIYRSKALSARPAYQRRRRCEIRTGRLGLQAPALRHQADLYLAGTASSRQEDFSRELCGNRADLICFCQARARHCVRVAKEMDSKSIGLCPQGFESPRCRFVTLLPKMPTPSRTHTHKHQERSQTLSHISEHFWVAKRKEGGAGVRAGGWGNPPPPHPPPTLRRGGIGEAGGCWGPGRALAKLGRVCFPT